MIFEIHFASGFERDEFYNEMECPRIKITKGVGATATLHDWENLNLIQLQEILYSLQDWCGIIKVKKSK